MGGLSRLLGALRPREKAAAAALAAAPVSAPLAAPAVDWKAQGNAALGAGDMARAADCYRQATAADPQDGAAWLNLGFCLLEQGDLPAAGASLDRALAVAGPGAGYAHDLHYLRGRAWCAQGEREQGIASFRAAIAARPDFVEAQLELAQALHAQGRPAEALATLDSVLQREPAMASALEGRGTMLLALGRPQEALAAFDGAIAAAGATADVLSNRAAALAELGRAPDALAALDQALALDPAHAGALYNQGHTLCTLLRVRESLAVTERGLQIHPANADLAWNRALALLLLGDMAPGWRDFEARWHATALGARQAPPQLAAQSWSGRESLQGRSIVLFCEQGLGDTIQFLRFVPAVAAQARQVFVRVQRPLVKLASAALPACTVLAEDEKPAGVDFQCSLMSLPLALGRTGHEPAAAAPYLQADPVRIAEWRRRLAAAPGLRVGLAWTGNPQHRNDRNRSVPLALLAPLAVPGVTFVTVQPKLPRELTHLPGAAAPLLRLGDELADFTDTAALLGALDLVISVDTSVAHLAGALGRPTWILLPYCPDWRWLLQRQDSPWYAGARLFRQPGADDWPAVLADVARELAAMASHPRGS